MSGDRTDWHCGLKEVHDCHDWIENPDTYASRPHFCAGVPHPNKVVQAYIETSWACHACHADNDVWGEGAVGSWMECGHCFEYSYLTMDDPGPALPVERAAGTEK